MAPSLKKGVRVTFKQPNHFGRWPSIAVSVALVFPTMVLAAQPVKPPPPPEPVTYTLVELSALKGWVAAINELNQVVEAVGYLNVDSGEEEDQRAYHWTIDPWGNVLTTELQTVPGAPVISSLALDVNNVTSQ